MTESISPEIKQTLTEYLSVGIAQFLETSMKGYFPNPASPDARDVMLAAVAQALRQVTENDPTARATLRTFALELLETE